MSSTPFKNSNIIMMWLNREQIKNGFYLSIDSENSSNNNSFEIYPKEKAELNIGEIYSYFITKENKQMEFYISGNIKDNYDRVTLWAQGKKDIKTKLTGINANYTRGNNCNYSAYYLIIENKHNYSFSLKIDAM